MTPKEKAIELVDKINVEIDCDCIISEMVRVRNIPRAKQCALIAVYEIIESLKKYGSDNDELQNMDRVLDYWDEVRYEIQNL